MDKGKVKLEQIDAKLQHERTKLGTYTAELQTFEERWAADALPPQSCQQSA